MNHHQRLDQGSCDGNVPERGTTEGRPGPGCGTRITTAPSFSPAGMGYLRTGSRSTLTPTDVDGDGSAYELADGDPVP